MSRKTEKIKKLRIFILQQISGLSSQQLNFIPEGLTNNIIWSLAHLISATQNVCYKRAGLPVRIEEQLYTDFLPGTRPAGYINDEEISGIKKLFISTIDNLDADLRKNRFKDYTRSKKIEQLYGVQITGIDDALDFILYYDGFHSGNIATLKHLV